MTLPGRKSMLPPGSEEVPQPSQASALGEDPDASLSDRGGPGSRLGGGHDCERPGTCADSGTQRPEAMLLGQLEHSPGNSGCHGHSADKGGPAAGTVGTGRNDTLSHAPGLSRDEGLDSSSRTGHAQRVTTVHPALTTRPGIRQDLSGPRLISAAGATIALGQRPCRWRRSRSAKSRPPGRPYPDDDFRPLCR
jgi:hypothetical protein